ncbi:hypothetical protein [Halomarina ordinaria]|uniref:Sulfatase-like hydrolase/transferase n=1 Tax=Halomarina ordinaria TaxID=3033939 RepID=A0ABD5UEQ4_9EURY|nr:hypothetical protein [Halomarina sp. PSRA2]
MGTLGELTERTVGTALVYGCPAFVNRVRNVGTPIWERDWDVLLVLDACRTDLMREVADEYDFVGRENVGTLWSVGSKSNEWMERTFAREHAADVERTAYVTSNPFTSKVRFGAEPAVLDEVWKYAWDDDVSTVPPRPVTDRAIDTWREGDADRMVVHYMQPHGPFLSRPDMGTYGDPADFGVGFSSLWGEAGRTIPMAEVWKAYRDNLRLVLDDVALLLANLDAERVAISADHGNAVGEWGVYGHPGDVLLPCIRRVPWVETTGTDTGEYDPETAREEENVEDLEERLRSLGYK